ncbi:Auxin efflux carrier component 5 [Dichanthelium oligosanthes]|uniref:Auxin efflux carrier component 5 n=1 Tax=Dichanthelium oligosanthes TaxID=888268 RepID=A0A1E5WET8_9POAL|nr:Auxin efflux carrier component 5 [Dichanthelium oligosanthes]
MISWGDVYKVASAMVPLYVPLLLGFWSVRWWKIFTPEQCESVKSLVAFFAIPFFTFGFTVHIDPFRANYRAIAADVISKGVIAAVIGGWVLLARGRRNNAVVNWSITGFSLSTLTSSLVVGVPMAHAMYGEWAQQLVVQLSVFQAIVGITLILFALEVRKATLGTQIRHSSDVLDSGARDQEGVHQIDDTEASIYADDDVSTTSVLSQSLPPQASGVQASTEFIAVVPEGEVSKDVIGGTQIAADGPDSTAPAQASHRQTINNVEASIDDDPAYVDDTSTFPQSLLVNDGVEASNAAAKSVVPVTGGRPSIWTLFKAAVPQSITSFIFAKEYGLHPDVLSTAVIVGMLVSVTLIVLLHVGRGP